MFDQHVRQGSSHSRRSERKRDFGLRGRSAYTWAVTATLLLHGASVICAEVVEIVGPRTVEPVVEAVFRSIEDEAGEPRLEYRTIELRSAAIEAVHAGIDVVFAERGWAEEPLADDGEGVEWKRHLVGGRAVALVAHRRNPMDEIGIEQLRALFSRRAHNWKDFGGGDAAIRRYGLRPRDPLSGLFYRRVLPPGRCGLIQRRGSSEEVLKAIASDPAAVGYIDAADVAAVGMSVKVLALAGETDGRRQSPEAVKPDARSVRDGSYPVSERLFAYVAEDTGEATSGFVEVMLSTDGQALIRKHGYVPTIRGVRNEGSAAFNRLYGREVKNVRATAGVSDDLALAQELIRTAAKLDLEPDVVEAMCDTAFDLSGVIGGGEFLAFRAATTLRRKVGGLEAQAKAELMRAKVYLAAYREQEYQADAERAIGALIRAAEAQTTGGRHGEALRSWRRAHNLARQTESAHLALVEERMPAFERRVKAVAERADLAALLRKRPEIRSTRKRMLKLLLLELDNPGNAADFLDPSSPESFKVHLPLAAKDPKELEVEALLSLAEWYVELLPEAGKGGRELIECRARRYYRRFYREHRGRDDALASRAKLGIYRMGADAREIMRDADRDERGARRRSRRPRQIQLSGGERATSTRLAEFVSRDPSIRRVSPREIGPASAVRDLRPLTFLDSLVALHLDEAGAVADLQPLCDMPSLNALTLSGIKVANISAIGKIEGLKSLAIRDTGVDLNLRPLDSLDGLQSLDLSGCERVSDLRPLTQLESLEKLKLARCKGISDLRPLTELGDTLTALDISHIGRVADVEPLAALGNLETLMMRGVALPDPDDLEWLRRKLPNCQIYH